MNLNFIQDNDNVHVQTQNQITYKQQIILKMKLLKEDLLDYQIINTNLKQVNNNFSLIVKDLFEHIINIKQKKALIQQKDKKLKLSIPYIIIKRIQTLKNKLIHTTKQIQNQNNHYKTLISNTQNIKKSQIRFYKHILNQYQTKRQYFKKQTLQLEDRIQEIQNSIKLYGNQNHKFIDYYHKVIQYDAIKKYQNKIMAIQRLLSQMKKISNAKKKLANYILKHKKYSSTQLINQPKVHVKSILSKSFIQIQQKLLNAKILKKQLILKQIQQTKKQNLNKTMVNNKLKSAILKSQQQKYFLELQSKFKDKLISTDKKDKKITKTDNLIYIKQLNLKLKQYLTKKQINFKHMGKKISKSI